LSAWSRRRTAASARGPRFTPVAPLYTAIGAYKWSYCRFLRDASLIRNCLLLGPYSRPVPRAL